MPHATISHKTSPQRQSMSKPSTNPRATARAFGAFFTTCTTNTRKNTATAIDPGHHEPGTRLYGVIVYIRKTPSTSVARPLPTANKAAQIELLEPRTMKAHAPKMSAPNESSIAGMKSIAADIIRIPLSLKVVQNDGKPCVAFASFDLSLQAATVGNINEMINVKNHVFAIFKKFFSHRVLHFSRLHGLRKRHRPDASNLISANGV